MIFTKAKITRIMIDFFDRDNRRIEHALNVMLQAELILAQEDIACDYEIVTATALLHDVGIKPSEEKLGYNNGKTQEEFGPPVAEKLLKSIDFPPLKIEKIKEIIGNHHSPSRYDYPELEILKRADRIVNRSDETA
jgi:HD superfamily phosphodiesterase